jgi:hypothetical protein
MCSPGFQGLLSSVSQLLCRYDVPPSGAVAAALGPNPPKPSMIVGHTDEQPNIETPGWGCTS